MLPVEHRLKAPADFTASFRDGARAAATSAVVHVRRPPGQDPPGTTRVGFVVSKKVGNAVTRNRVKRRLRHLVRDLEAPFVTDVVIRALPPAAEEQGTLESDLRSAWRRAFQRAS